MIYACTGFIYPDIGTNHVSIQDMFYIGHSLMFNSLYLTLGKIYKNGNQKVHWSSTSMIIVLTGAAVVTFILEMGGIIAGNKYFNTAMF